MSMEGKTQVVYIPDELRREVETGLRRYKELRKLIERICKADTKKLRTRARRNKKR